jgi:hypothetical protein
VVAIGSAASGFTVTRLGACKPTTIVGLVLLTAGYLTMALILSPGQTQTDIAAAADVDQR